MAWHQEKRGFIPNNWNKNFDLNFLLTLHEVFPVLSWKQDGGVDDENYRCRLQPAAAEGRRQKRPRWK